LLFQQLLFCCGIAAVWILYVFGFCPATSSKTTSPAEMLFVFAFVTCSLKLRIFVAGLLL